MESLDWLETEFVAFLEQLQHIQLVKINKGHRFRVGIDGRRGSIWFQPRPDGVQMCPHGATVNEVLLPIATRLAGEPELESRGYFIWRILPHKTVKAILASIDVEINLSHGDYSPTSDFKSLETKVQELYRHGFHPHYIPKGKIRPEIVETMSRSIKRDPQIVAWIRSNAQGKCELCLQPAPFKDQFGKPYLEVHHVIELSKGGHDTIKNTVALCPNCHRAVHHAADTTFLQEQLYLKVERLRTDAFFG